MGSIEQTNFLKLSASNTYSTGTDGQYITETLSTEIENSHNIQLSADFYFVNLDPVVNQANVFKQTFTFEWKKHNCVLQEFLTVGTPF